MGELHPKVLAGLLQNSSFAIEDMPHCLAGSRPVRWTALPLSLNALGPMTLDKLEHIVTRFAASRYRAKSTRCRECADTELCRGLQIHRVRAFGLSVLQPRG